MKLKIVTVTGADDSIEPIELCKISEEYPFVEWGILLSKSSMGGVRFPSYNWLGKLADMERLPLSGHICGRWVRDICDGGHEICTDMNYILPIFKRFQLNFHSYLHRIKSARAFIGSLKSLSIEHQQIILQFDDVNNVLLDVVKEGGVDAVPLFDLSGGAGVLPARWKEPVGGYCGYAGGLSPNNLQAQLEKLEPIVKEHPIWIDAETHLRSMNDTVFDLGKVRQFLETASSWVTE